MIKLRYQDVDAEWNGEVGIFTKSMGEDMSTNRSLKILKYV